MGPKAWTPTIVRRVSKTPLVVRQSEKFFFLPTGRRIMGSTENNTIAAWTIEGIATGKIRAVLKEESKDFTGIEGVYEDQDRIQTSLNVNKIYPTFPEKN